MQFVHFQDQDYKKIIEECKKQKTTWKDPKFPSSQESIGNLLKGKIKWKRSNQSKLVVDGVDPNDIIQGGLGDCYFLSALSILAEHPKRMEKIFATPEIDSGVFAANLFLDGIPTIVAVDDHIPCLSEKGTPAFSKNNGKEVWVMMMEKVYAKCYGGYEKIEGGCVGDALSDMTGAPYQIFKTQGTAATPPEELWKILLDAENNKYLLAASVPDTPEVDLEKLLGLVEGHAYGILDVRSAQGHKLIKIRNPWGDSMEWNGDFSDNSNLWTESLKKEVGFQKLNDGTFWIKFEDFIKYYNDIVIVYYKDDYIQSYNKVNLPAQRSTSFPIVVSKPSKIRVCFNQVRNTDLIHLRLSVTNSSNQVLGTSGKALSSAEVICTNEMDLAPGTYNAVVDVYSKDVEKLPRGFTLSSYGNNTLQYK